MKTAFTGLAVLLLLFSSLSAQRRDDSRKDNRKPVTRNADRKPNWRYSGAPRRNAVVTTVPTGNRVVTHKGIRYRYSQGTWYKPQNRGFVVVAAPVGVVIQTLPVGYLRVQVNRVFYYYYNGTYYDRQASGQYVVMSPPGGAIVESIPNGYESIVINGETYYTADGAQYKPVVQDNGEIWYQVIKSN